MKKLLFLFSLFIIPSMVFGATNGTKGETSEGSAVITLKIPEMIIATGFADLTVDVNDKTADTVNNFPIAATDYVASDTICVASNNSRTEGNKYSLKVTSSNNTSSTDYFVVDEASNKVYFNLNYAAGTTNEDLAQSTASGTDFVAHTSLVDCDSSATDNATYTVTFTATGGTTAKPSIDMVPAGIYDTTLTFLFTPNNESTAY